MNPEAFFIRINKISLYLLLFFVPIFFLPFTQNVLDFPKSFLASILILFSLFGWAGKMVFSRKIVLLKNNLFYFIIFLISLSLFLSLLFSLNPSFSFFGYPSEITDSFFVLFLWLIFTFLLLNSFETKIEFLPLSFLLIFSGLIVGILNLFQIQNLFIFPFDFAKFPSFNLIGTPNSLALFLAILFPVSFVLFLKGKGIFKIIFGLSAFVLFLNILLINFKTAWFVLAIEVLLLFIFGARKEIKISFVFPLIFILALSIFFYFFPQPLPGFPTLPPEISLSFPAEIFIIKKAFTHNLKNFILGTGPGTFIFDYSFYRPPLLNQTIFWGTRFSKGHSLFLDWILTKGIFGGVVLLFFFIFSLLFIFSYLRKLQEKDEFFEIKVGLVASFGGIIFSSFFYPFNLSLYFLFWFLVASIFFYFTERKIQIDLSSVGKSLFSNTVFVLVVALSLSGIFFQCKRYLAEVNYWKSIQFLQRGDFESAINFLQRAIKFNSSLDIYWRDLSQIYLAKANAISQNPNLNPEEKRNLLTSTIALGADAINRAINLLPQNVANWNVRGFFYQNLVGIEGAAEQSLNSYQKAIELEPSSPYSYTEKGRVYILMAQDFAKKGDEKSQKEYLGFAISILEKALELKSDYAPAHYLLAVAYDQLEKSDEAIAKLEETKSIAPQDFGLAFQLGILYWRKNDIQKAKEEFERAINLNQDYSNAHYMLGLVFEKMGEREKAISHFEKVLELNPENEEIKKIIENLKKGIPPLEGITLPVQEKPPEIK